MGNVDSFSSASQVTIPLSDLYALVQQAATAELILNAVKCRVPHRGGDPATHGTVIGLGI